MEVIPFLGLLLDHSFLHPLALDRLSIAFVFAMFALPSLLAVAVWFTKPPLGSQARITVNNPDANTIFQIVGINKDGVEHSNSLCNVSTRWRNQAKTATRLFYWCPRSSSRRRSQGGGSPSQRVSLLNASASRGFHWGRVCHSLRQ